MLSAKKPAGVTPEVNFESLVIRSLKNNCDLIEDSAKHEQFDD